MAFALTRYIFPLQSEILMSTNEHYTLDNPRTHEEKEFIKDLIGSAFEPDLVADPLFPSRLAFDIAVAVTQLVEKFKIIEKYKYSYNYFNNFIARRATGDDLTSLAVDLISSTWIIVRYPDDKIFEMALNDSENLFDVIFENNGDSSYVRKYDELSGFCKIVTLLSVNDFKNYTGESFFLLGSPYAMFQKNNLNNILPAIGHFLYSTKHFPYYSQFDSELAWANGHDVIVENASRLDKIFKEGIKEKISQTNKNPQHDSQKPKKLVPPDKELINPLKDYFVHVGYLLNMAYDQKGKPEIMLTLLSGIIEYLLVKGDKDLTIQFKSKPALVMYTQDRSVNLVELRKELSEIYDVRSMVAHGRQSETPKTKQQIMSYNRTLLKCIKEIINCYINDRQYVEFVKSI